MALSVNCPACGELLDVDDAHRTWKVRCPRCRHEFYPDRTAAEADDDSPPPRRRGRRDLEIDDQDLAAVARDVSPPGIFLELTGWLGVMGTLLAAGLLVTLGVVTDKPGQRGGEDPLVLVFLGACVGTLGLPYYVAVVYGARKFRHCSSRSWAMASAILSIASITLFGVCGVVSIAAGIWALVVMQRPEVRAAFDYNASRFHGEPPADDWSD